LSLSAAAFAALVFSERARRVDDPKAVDEAIGELTREGRGVAASGSSLSSDAFASPESSESPSHAVMA
jgi:hypothetical protein